MSIARGETEVGSRPLSIGIVGGSIAGCLTAIELRARGHRVTVFEYSHAELKGLLGAGLGTPTPMFRTMLERGHIGADLPHLTLEFMEFVGQATGSHRGHVALRLPLIFVAFHWPHAVDRLQARGGSEWSSLAPASPGSAVPGLRRHGHGGRRGVARRLGAGPGGGANAMTPDELMEEACRLAEEAVRNDWGHHLRDVDLSRAGFRRLKRRCIEELGMGTNTKVILQFRRRPESFGNWNGELVTDRPFLDTWQSSLGQAGRAGLITVYSGGRVGAGYPGHPPHAPAPPSVVRETLAALDRAVPGIARDFNGRAWLDNWSADPWTHGSYAAFLPGQYTEFYGVIKSAEGGVHFAGEQTSDAYQGFLEGAVASGERCAHEVLSGES